jgi:hypothetical protein
LGFTNTAKITGSWNGVNGTLTLAGSTTLANYQSALRSVTYTNTSDNPSTLTRTLTIVVNDGAGSNNLSAAVSRQIVVTAVNDAPVVANVEGTPLSYLENQAPTPISATLTVSDADSVNLVGATVQITGNYASSQDVLGFASTASITGSWTAGTGTLTLTGSDAVANYQSALRSVTYTNTSDTPSTLTRTLTIVVNDGAGSNNLSAAVSRQIVVTAVHDAPVVANVEGTPLSYLENQAPTPISGTLTVSDVDSVNLVAATVQISGNYASGQDVLGFANTTKITGSWTAVNGTLTLTGSTTLANYQSALRSVTYTNTSNNPSTLTRTLTIVVNDGAGSNNLSAAVSRQIVVTAVNDAPSFQKGADVAVAQNSAPYNSVTNWATAISPGPGETNQTVHFQVSADKPYLFSAQPALNASGVLTFAPALNLRGTTLVTVWLQDNGGTANGGVDTSSSQTFTITVGLAVDTNRNGLPDDWERAYFGNASAVPDEDTDGDGFTNLQEYEAGTNPLDPADAPGITSTEPTGNDVIVSFKTILGKKYAVEYRDVVPDGPWIMLANGLDGIGGILQVVDGTAAEQLHRFYRVRVLP